MAILGDLEHQVMTVLWESGRAMTVRDVHDYLLRDRDLAYTTVMTVLDRLAKKHLVVRELENRAWLYRPAISGGDLVASEMVQTLEAIPGVEPDALDAFVELLDAARRQRLAEALGLGASRSGALDSGAQGSGSLG